MLCMLMHYPYAISYFAHKPKYNPQSGGQVLHVHTHTEYRSMQFTQAMSPIMYPIIPLYEVIPDTLLPPSSWTDIISLVSQFTLHYTFPPQIIYHKTYTALYEPGSLCIYLSSPIDWKLFETQVFCISQIQHRAWYIINAQQRLTE